MLLVLRRISAGPPPNGGMLPPDRWKDMIYTDHVPYRGHALHHTPLDRDRGLLHRGEGDLCVHIVLGAVGVEVLATVATVTAAAVIGVGALVVIRAEIEAGADIVREEDEGKLREFLQKKRKEFYLNS